jgi:glycosylphosphatidylinositol deacylase
VSLPSDVVRKYPRYGLFAYGEGHTTGQVRQMKFTGIPVLFIPGNIGSHRQGKHKHLSNLLYSMNVENLPVRPNFFPPVRSLASVSLWKTVNSHTPFHFDYFAVELNEEYSALFGGVLKEQRDFVHQCLYTILAHYQNNESKPTSVILIGHSMVCNFNKLTFMWCLYVMNMFFSCKKN